MREKKNYPIENLSEEQLDILMQYTIPLQEENIEHIKERFLAEKKPSRKYRSKRLLIAACIGFVFFVGFTQLNRMRDVFQSFFGNNSDYITQYGELIQNVDQSNGIKMELIATINDNGQSYTFFTLTDETGNRINENIQLKDFGLLNSNGEVIGDTCQLLSYDAELNTATFIVLGRDTPIEEITTFQLSSFLNQLINVQTEPLYLDIVNLVLSHQATFELLNTNLGYSSGWDHEQMESLGLNPDLIADTYIDNIKIIEEQLDVGGYTGQPTGIPFLRADELNALIPGFEKGYISNISYQENLLRIQIKTAFDYEGSVSLYLQHSVTGAILPSIYYITQEDLSDFVFYIDSTDTLNFYGIVVEGQYYNASVDGRWEVSFQGAKPIEPRLLAANLVMYHENNEMEIYNVSISPLSIGYQYKDIATVEVDEHGVVTESMSALNPDILLYYKNGVEKYYEPLYKRTSQRQGGYTAEEVGGNIIIIEDLEGISIGGTYISMP